MRRGIVAESNVRGAIVPVGSGDAVQRIISESLRFAVAIGEGLETPDRIVPERFNPAGGWIKRIQWVGHVPFASHHVIRVAVSLGRVVRVLYGMKQARRIIGVCRDCIGTGILSNRLLCHPVHVVEQVISYFLAIWASDFLLMPCRVILNCGEL